MMAINKTYMKPKRRIISLGILLFIIIFPLIFNPYLFDYFNMGNTNIENQIKNGVKNKSPLSSSSHPISADDFNYYKYITIDHTKVSGTVNLFDFPVMISILDSDLHDNTQPDGDDIAFASDFQWLDHEIEYFNQTYNTTHAYLITWVRIPVLSATNDTIIRMYYGNSFIESRENPSGVWNNNYKGVWHLNELSGGTGKIIDSSFNENHGTDYGSPLFDSQGQIDGSIDLEGNIEDDYIELPDSASLTDITEGDYYTYEAWVNPDQVPPGVPLDHNNRRFGIMIKKDPHQGLYYEHDQYFAIEHWLDVSGVPTVKSVSSGTYAPGSYYHLVGVVSNFDGFLKLYVNGNLEAETTWTGGTTPWDYGTKPLRFGIANPGASIYRWPFDGKIDEIRISDTNRSADWIATEYSNQFNPNNFYSVGSAKQVYIPTIFDFEYFKEIIIDHTKVSGTSNLIDFPILISFFDSDLHDKVQPNGNDIAFNNGTSWLFHEIELFNQTYNSTHAQLIAWVRIPTLSPLEDTVIRMYFGNSTMNRQENPNGVWDSNFLGIWHLKESGTGALNEYFDSSHYGNHGQGGEGNSSYIPTQATGKIGNAQDFNNLDGYYDLIDCGNNSLWDIDGYGITLQAWIQHDITPNYHVYGIMNHKGWYDGYSMFINYGGGMGIKPVFCLTGETHQLVGANDVTAGTWHHIVATYNGSIMKIFVDGVQDPNVLVKTNAIEPSSSEKDFWIGHGDQPKDKIWSAEWEGQIDEVRISNIGRSSDWILTEYNNQNNPNQFYTITNSTQVLDEKPSNSDFFNYFKMIQIDHRRVSGEGSHTNFPLLISIFDEDLRYDTQTDGDDIAFSLGTTWLDHEIELFNQNYNGTHAQLMVWVRIPELSCSLDTFIRMYYGNSTMISRQNPTGLWSSSYKGVWHLGESSGVTIDSTSYNENGIATGTVIRPSSGQIGNAYNYGTDGTFNVGDPADGHLDFGLDSFMVSMWINIDTSTGAPQIPLYKGASSTFDRGYCFGTPTTGDKIAFHITDGTSNVGSPSADITFDTWAYIVGIVDRTNDLIRIYKNGTEVGTGTDISTILDINGNIEFQCANPTYDFDGLLDEVRVLNETHSNDWIKTEYYNQYDPSVFYTIGLEQGVTGIMYSNIQINTVDLLGNSVPFANVSIYNQTKLIQSNLADGNGTLSIINLIQAEYNFTVSITSDIGNCVEIVNTTFEAILINQSFQIVNLICNVGSNFFEVVDIDGVYLDSGWIIVGNSSQELQNCSIDANGHARFWWVNTTPYEYNYTVYYQDNNYNPNIIQITSGDINTPNSSIQIQAALTTIDFTIQTLITKQPVSGVKCILTATTSGESIVNLTTDNDGKATLRWLNSTGINGNYSLRLEFFGISRLFNMSSITQTLVTETNFTVSAKDVYNIYIEVSLENYKTELISLNPTEYISLEWGTQLRLRSLFNVSKAVGAEQLLGPTYSDIMTYEIFKGADLIQSGTMGTESRYIGTHYSLIDTKELESDITYLIFISAQKSGYSIPQDLLLQLNILKNNLILNQSENDDSIPSVYWSDNIDLSVKAYGEISESFTNEIAIFQNMDHSFKFFLSNINTNWNLTQITFNIYNISWNVNASDIYLSIVDPYGINRIFNTSNHAGWDYNLGIWTGITIDLNKRSPTGDNSFEFIINGTFDGTIDVITEASFIRNNINVQYYQYNVSDSISILSASEGWAMKNVSFIIQNCYNISSWEKVDLTPLTNLNITTLDGFSYSLRSGDANGSGESIIDDRIIYPVDNQFLFNVESDPNIMFDVIIKAEFVQIFYQNQYLEILNRSSIIQNIPHGGSYQLSLTDNDWEESYIELLVDNINNGTQYFTPSQLAMNITIGSQTYSIKNTFLGQGSFSLINFNKDILYNAIIHTNQQVNFTLSLKVSYFRTAVFETLGSVTYVIRDSPDIYGTVEYYPDLRYYLQTIDTSFIDAGYYTVRFEINNENYNLAVKDLDFFVMKRLTFVNGEATIAKLVEFMYVKDSINFTFLYTDALTGVRITDLKTQNYMWEKYDINGNVTANGEGTLIQTFDDSLVLDFDSEIRTVGDYLLIITLEKDNYEYKNAIIRLAINKRELDYSLGDVFKNYQTSVVHGKIVQIEINLTDPTRGGIPLLNASVLLTIGGIEYKFTELANGTYMLEFSTRNVKAFFSSKTIRGIINISREDYFSEEFFITIVVKMEEIFPGMPTFYFLIIIFSILGILGSIIGYRVYKYATIPTFVKNVREMKKLIKKEEDISKSLLYSSKEVFIGERVRDKWSSIGLSLEEILGFEMKKSKKIYEPKRIKPEKIHDLKPLGIILMKWDERIGTEILTKYPSDINIEEKTMIQVYSTHEYSGEKGVINLTVGSMNILSYYTGPESGYYIVLFLKLEDDPDMYEGAMANVSRIILQNLEEDTYLQMIPSIFQRLSVYPSLNYEQILISYLEDEIKRMIINILRDFGVITKSELVIWVKDKKVGETIDLEAVLADLIKGEIIKVASVKGIPSEVIFLTKDIFMLRVPPDILFKNPEAHGLPPQFSRIYREDVQKFFNGYYPNEDDNLKLLDVLIDPEIYQTLQLLRKAIATMEDFDKLKNKGVSDIYSVLKKLYDTQMIKVFKDENGVEYYTLITDFYISAIFPKYILNVIEVINQQKSKSDKVLIQYLNILEETYLNLKSEK